MKSDKNHFLFFSVFAHMPCENHTKHFKLRFYFKTVLQQKFYFNKNKRFFRCCKNKQKLDLYSIN